MSNAIKLEKSLDKLATALSELDDQISEIQDASVPDTKSTCSKFAVWRILESIDSDAANLAISVELWVWYNRMCNSFGFIFEFKSEVYINE